MRDGLADDARDVPPINFVPGKETRTFDAVGIGGLDLAGDEAAIPKE